MWSRVLSSGFANPASPSVQRAGLEDSKPARPSLTPRALRNTNVLLMSRAVHILEIHDADGPNAERTHL